MTGLKGIWPLKKRKKEKLQYLIGISSKTSNFQKIYFLYFSWTLLFNSYYVLELESIYSIIIKNDINNAKSK